MRLILIAIFLYIFVQLAQQFLGLAGLALDPSSFIAGLVVAAQTAFMAFRVDGWWSSATRLSRPQSVKNEAKEISFQITRPK
jgi:hypothetical protein